MSKPIKIRVKKSDSARILHTEVLPYEIPIFTSNERLYRYAKSEKLQKKAPPLVRHLLHEGCKKYSMPFSYVIWQGKSNKRILSIIHPGWQLKFISFYEQYGDALLSLSKKSAFSIRYPTRIASYFYESPFAKEGDELKSESAEQEGGSFGDEATHASTYFSYARYSQLYRFVESDEFLELETRFPILLRFDVSKCFASIYTHSISWAIKGKAFAKRHRNAIGIDGAFDGLMQGANYGETNGIVIGPEVSRIFAEVVLQEVDRDISSELTRKKIPDDEYAVRRYVDDYFVFVRSREVGERILEVAEEKLLNFKLSINASKTAWAAVPYATPQSIAKADVMRVLKGTLLGWLKGLQEAGTEEYRSALSGEWRRVLREPSRSATALANDVKVAVKRAGVTFDVVSSPALGSITHALYRLHRRIADKVLTRSERDELHAVILVTIDLVFFLHALDFRVRTTYFVSQIILILKRLTATDVVFERQVESSCRARIEKIFLAKPKRDRAGLEHLTLLVALRTISPERNMAPELLNNLLADQFKESEHDVGSSAGLNYFDIVSVLYYIRDVPIYVDLKTRITELVSKKLLACKEVSLSAELVMLFLDMLSCPFVGPDTKRGLVEAVMMSELKKKASLSEIGEVVNFALRKLCFTNWTSDAQLEKILLKKRLKPAY